MSAAFTLLVSIGLLMPGSIADPVRRHHGIQHAPLTATHLTFWKDQECTQMNGHLRWSISDNTEWHLIPPGTAAVSMDSAQQPCKIFMCAQDSDSDCKQEQNVLGPIEANACNIGVMQEADMSQTMFSMVSVRCDGS